MGTRGMGHLDNGQWGTGVWDTWAMGPMGVLLPKYQKDVKLSKKCQMSKNQTPTLWRRFTKKIETMRFTDIDVNFDVTNDGH